MNQSYSKPHYQILDGLRGVAALMVICYHVFEGFATSPLDQHFNHGYLAVDFFFILSGFVIGYAYDDRWKMTMTTKDFFKRRLIRLHPMVIFGAVLGTITFCIQGSVQWDGTHVATSMVMIAMLLTMFLIPAVPGTGVEVRGNSEMFPLNGPTWSLFFEYIGNILYAVFVRRLSTKTIAVMVAVLGVLLAAFAVSPLSGWGYLGAGWSLSGYNVLGGMLRMMFSYSAGLFLSRIFNPFAVRGAFWICSLAIVVLVSMPRVGGAETMWLNALYEVLCVVVLFPAILYVGASSAVSDRCSAKICKLLGDISYPLYVVHYPFMYLFYAWLWSSEPSIPFSQAWPVAVGLVVGNILLAYLCLKFYDEPVRKWLSNSFLNKK